MFKLIAIIFLISALSAPVVMGGSISSSSGTTTAQCFAAGNNKAQQELKVCCEKNSCNTQNGLVNVNIIDLNKPVQIVAKLVDLKNLLGSSQSQSTTVKYCCTGCTPDTGDLDKSKIQCNVVYTSQ